VPVGDGNGAGNPDLVTAADPGPTILVRIVDDVTGNVLPFDVTWTNGLFVAVGDTNRDGCAEVSVDPEVFASHRYRNRRPRPKRGLRRRVTGDVNQSNGR
jgi:hypothetical protein